MLIVAHHGIEPLLPAALGVSALALHYVRAWVRVRPRRKLRRTARAAGD